MEPTILCFSNKKSGIFDLISRNLPAQYSVTAINNNAVSRMGNGKMLVLIDASSVRRIELPNAILVFEEAYLPQQELILSSDNICIAGADNLPLLQLLAKSQTGVITYGMCPKNTITCSSKSDHAISVSLQRQITSLKGQVIEPLELVFTGVSGISPDALLAYAAILMLLGAVTECPDKELTIR